MRVTDVLEDRERLGDLLAGTKLTTVTLLGAVNPQPTYPTSPAAIRILSDRYDLIFPNDLGEAVMECCVRFGWAIELDFDGYESAEAEVRSIRDDAAAALIRSPCEVWRERAPHAERWMTVQRATLNRHAAMDLLQVASTTFHFQAHEAEELGRFWRWIAPSGGIALAVVHQWEPPHAVATQSSSRRSLVDAA